MARIKKPGLDYFPLDTQFVNNRAVRRIMKHRGDGALAVLLHVYSAIYAGKGYYVEATDLFFEDVADCLFTQDTDDVRQVVRLARCLSPPGQSTRRVGAQTGQCVTSA